LTTRQELKTIVNTQYFNDLRTIIISNQPRVLNERLKPRESKLNYNDKLNKSGLIRFYNTS